MIGLGNTKAKPLLYLESELWDSEAKCDSLVIPLGVLLSLLDELCQLAKQRTTHKPRTSSRQQRSACPVAGWCPQLSYGCCFQWKSWLRVNSRHTGRLLVGTTATAGNNLLPQSCEPLFYLLFLCLSFILSLSFLHAVRFRGYVHVMHRSANEYDKNMSKKTSDRSSFLFLIIWL